MLTDDADLAAPVRLLGAHGSPRKYEHAVLGFNSRLDTLQAVVLSAKLRRLDGWNAARRAAAARYDELLADVDGRRGADRGRRATSTSGTCTWSACSTAGARRAAVLGKLNAAASARACTTRPRCT